VLALTILATPAGADDGCGTLSFSFAGTRLLNDGISNSAGPFRVDIPAGVYTVTLIASDNHDSQIDAESQSGEQYHVVLDSGYVSPASIDIPDDANTSKTVISSQVIEQSNSISVRHGGAPGINSVDVVCVGFTPVAPAPEPAPEPATPEPVTPGPVTPAPEAPTPEPEPVSELVPSVDPVVAEPGEDGTNVDEPPVEEQPADEPAPVQDIGDPVQLVRDPPGATDAPAIDAPAPTPQVEGIPVTRDGEIPLLAITGPSTEAVTLVSAGLLFIALGGVLLRRERRYGDA